MHLTLDEQGKMHVPPQLMEALGIVPGDMLSFSFDDAGIHVKGEKRTSSLPPHPLPPARGSQRQAAENQPTAPVLIHNVTQMNLFGEASQQQLPQTRRSKSRDTTHKQEANRTFVR